MACTLEIQAGKQAGSMLQQSKWQRPSLSILCLKHSSYQMRESATPKTKRAPDLEAEKGPSMSLVPLPEMGFNLNKREFRDPIKLRYDWPSDDIPPICVRREICTVDTPLFVNVADLLFNSIISWETRTLNSRILYVVMLKSLVKKSPTEELT